MHVAPSMARGVSRSRSTLVHFPYEQHRALDSQISMLESFLEPSRTDLLDGRWVADVERLVIELARNLERHFRNEETSELFLCLPQDYPRFAAKVETLRREHYEFRAELDVLIDGAEEVATAEDARALRERTRRFLGKLRHHEAAESDILLSAYLDDLAPGD